MKAIIVYSGKGGVGKTTTTANIARLLSQKGHKVFIIDADINTPSMNTEFESEHPQENIWIHSSGYMFNKFIYLEKSMVRQYLELAKKKLRQISPDSLIIPLDTHVHKMALELGLTNRKQADMKTAVEITNAMREIFPNDPIKGDFALFGYSVEHK